MDEIVHCQGIAFSLVATLHGEMTVAVVHSGTTTTTTATTTITTKAYSERTPY